MTRRQFGRGNKERDIAETRVALKTSGGGSSIVTGVTRTVTAGLGLTGGGVLTADISLEVNPGTGLGFSGDQLVLSYSGTPTTILPDSGAGAGVSLYAARIDHTHAIAAAAPGTIHPDDSSVEGVSTSFSRADHQHAAPCAAPTTNLSVSSTNTEGAAATFARSSHTHAIDGSSDVGTVPAAALLKSTPAGGLTLKTLTVLGAVDIAGGDLSVSGALGPNLLFVDYSQANIGINCAPDPQFDLDIAGNLRAQGWIVGKHALQLDGALLIAHFDGPEPYTTNYVGEPNGHRGQPGTIAGGAIFRPGKFLKGLQIAEATTNLIVNPSFETNTTGYAAYGAGVTITRGAGTTAIGSYKLTVTPPGAMTAFGVDYQPIAVTNGTTYTFSAHVYATAGEPMRLAITGTGGSGTATFTGLGGWQRVSLTFTASANGMVSPRVERYHASSTSSIHFVTDGWQFEAKAYPTPYADGSLGSGHSWSGTAHASTSSRTAARLTYAVTTLGTGAVGSLQAWVNPNKPAAYRHAVGDYDTIAECNYGAAGPILRLGYYAASAQLELVGLTASAITAAVLPEDTWSYVVATWDGSNVYLYVNGAQVGTAAQAASRTFGSDALEVGSWDGGHQFDGVIDEFAVFDRALPEDEVRAIYESNAPIFAETSTWHFRAANDLVWADSEGLWVRDVAGLPVLGVCGVAGKSWGGLTLNEGDILHGRYGASDGGWLLLDRDGVSSKPYVSLGYADVTVWQFDTGGASLNGVLDITTTGGIYQGSGSFASPTTGLKLWAEDVSGTVIGRLAGYDGGVIQAGFDTAGRVFGGPVRLDADGVTIFVSTDFAEHSPEMLKFKSGVNTYGLYRVRAGTYSSETLIQSTASADPIGTSTSVVNLVSRLGVTEAKITVSLNDNSYSFVELNASETVITGRVLMGDTANTSSTKGLTVNQGDAFDEVVSFKSSFVAHGITDSSETDTYGRMMLANASDGGLRITGLTEGTLGLYLQGYGTVDNTAKTTAAVGYVDIYVAKKSGTSVGAAGANANLLTVRNAGTTRWIVDAEGDTYRDGTDNAYDEYDDLALARAFELSVSPETVVRDEFDRFIQYNRADLIAAGILTEGGFYNESALLRLVNGAVWQIAKRLLRVEERLLTAGSP